MHFPCPNDTHSNSRINVMSILIERKRKKGPSKAPLKDRREEISAALAYTFVIVLKESVPVLSSVHPYRAFGCPSVPCLRLIPMPSSDPFLSRPPRSGVFCSRPPRSGIFCPSTVCASTVCAMDTRVENVDFSPVECLPDVDRACDGQKGRKMLDKAPEHHETPKHRLPNAMITQVYNDAWCEKKSFQNRKRRICCV